MSYVFYQAKYPGIGYDIPVKLGNITIHAANIDTASWSLFDISHAEKLGIDITKGYHYYDSGDKRYWLHKIPVSIGNLQPTIADVYFGELEATYPWVKKSQLREVKGHLGWANNGGLSNYIMDFDISNISFTDFSFINSLPRPINPYTVIKFTPPRLEPRLKDVILSNQKPYIDILVNNVPIKFGIDTGSTFTILKEKYAYDILGFNDITRGGKKIITVGGTVTMYRHKALFKIGNLAPKQLDVNFVGPNDIPHYEQFSDALLGIDNMNYFKLRFMKDRIMFEENPYLPSFLK
jgi:hypothetical protein